MRLVRASSRPRAVLRAIELCAVGDHVDAAEVATALGASSVSELAALNATARRWRAVELSRALQRRSANARLGALDDASRAALDALAPLRARFPAEDAFETAGGSTDERAGLGRLKDGRGGSWWETAKRPQLEWLAAAAERLVVARGARGVQRVVDIGGGKGNLANVIAARLGAEAATVRVVDVADSALERGRARAARGRLANIEYACADASDARALKGDGAPDVVVALHACGPLSDVAARHAAIHGASLAMVSCCYMKHREMKPLAGGMTAAEWLDVPAPMHEAVLRAAELQGDADVADVAMHSLAALRAAAVERDWPRGRDKPRLRVVRFPAAWSARNWCLLVRG